MDRQTNKHTDQQTTITRGRGSTNRQTDRQLITCWVKAVCKNALLWQPGELTQNHGQTDKQTHRPTDYYNPWPWLNKQTDYYRIAGVFRGYKCWGYKCSWFSRIRHVPRTFITTNLISHACMHAAKRRYSTKVKTFLKGISAKIYTLEIHPLSIRYTRGRPRASGNKSTEVLTLGCWQTRYTWARTIYTIHKRLSMATQWMQ